MSDIWTPDKVIQYTITEVRIGEQPKIPQYLFIDFTI